MFHAQNIIVIFSDKDVSQVQKNQVCFGRSKDNE